MGAGAIAAMRPLSIVLRARLKGEASRSPGELAGEGGGTGRRVWAGMVEERAPQAEGTAGAKAMMGSSGEGWLPGSTGRCVWGGVRWAVGDEAEGQEEFRRPRQGASLCPPGPQGPRERWPPTAAERSLGSPMEEQCGGPQC